MRPSEWGLYDDINGCKKKERKAWDTVTYTCCPSTPETESGVLGVSDHLWQKRDPSFYSSVLLMLSTMYDTGKKLCQVWLLNGHLSL